MLLRAVLFAVMFGPSFLIGWYIPVWCKWVGVPNVHTPVGDKAKIITIIMIPWMLLGIGWAGFFAGMVVELNEERVLGAVTGVCISVFLLTAGFLAQAHGKPLLGRCLICFGQWLQRIAA